MHKIRAGHRVVGSWLLDLNVDALGEDQESSDINAWVAGSNDGRWTIFEAIDLDILANVIKLAIQARLVRSQEDRYASKLLAAMRNQFGGHVVKYKE